MIIYPIILSGGSGSRLWPLSTKSFPKQYHSLYGKNSMFQETIIRTLSIPNIAPPIIICNESHRFLVKDQLNEIGVEKYEILLERQGKNTALAVTSAVLHVNESAENAYILVLSADHFIEDKDSFAKDVASSIKHAANDKLITFGVPPTEVNDNYGYIKTGKQIESLFQVEKFIEKPSINSAKKYIAEGNYLWNSGIFLFSLQRYLSEIRKHKTILDIAKFAVKNSYYDLCFRRLADYKDLKNKEYKKLSLDYVILESAKNMLVRPLHTSWSDLGTWKSVSNLFESSLVKNKSEVYSLDSYNCYVNSQKIVATLGLEDVIIVDTEELLMIANKEKIGLINEIQGKVKRDPDSINFNQKIFRPWGWFENINTGISHKVKKLHISPHSKLSLQSHMYRSENWTVISGIATVTLDGKEFQLDTNDSIQIPKGAKHSIENKTQKYVEVIEVQTGSYLGEDDIVRYEDLYGRV